MHRPHGHARNLERKDDCVACVRARTVYVRERQSTHTALSPWSTQHTHTNERLLSHVELPEREPTTSSLEITCGEPA
jgi:hypothetical protein